MVKKAGTKKFMLMTPDEVKPGGKLDKHNQAISNYNRRIRAAQKAAPFKVNKNISYWLANKFIQICAIVSLRDILASKE
jgi:hypothetical protein